VCLQELKAEADQVPQECRHDDDHAYGHSLKAYSGVSLMIRKDLATTEPVFGHPPEECALFEKLLGDHLVDTGRALDPDNENPFT